MHVPMTILVSRPDRIGDVIISTPCLPALRERFPEARLIFLVRPAMRPLLAGLDCLDELWILEDDETAETLAVRMREGGVDAVVHLEPNLLVEQAAQDADVRMRIGYTRTRGERLTHPFPYEKKRGLMHEAQYGFALLAHWGVGMPNAMQPCLRPEPAAQERAMKKLPTDVRTSGYAVIHLGVFGNKPRVPVSYFIAVIKRLRQLGLTTLIVGADATDADAKACAAKAACHGVLNCCGWFDLAELAWVLASARVYFSRDTGPAHLAAAMDCPTVTWFLQPNPVMHPRRWKPLGNFSYPLCAEVRQRFWESEHAFAKRHIRALPVSEVLSHVETALNARKSTKAGGAT